MHKLYEKFLELKRANNNKVYLFKSSIFYIALHEDAEKVATLFNSKILNLNDEIIKCGFLEKKLEHYSKLLVQNNIDFEIIDLKYSNVENYLDYLNNQKCKNIIACYNEVCKNTKNKTRVENLKAYKSIYISRIYNILINKSYIVGPYNKFIIYEPKRREIVSQNVQDKIINHLVSRFILYPALLPCLLDVNVASRKDMGTSKGLAYARDFNRKCKIKYGTYYVLKCDISKFFASIDHDILKKKLLRKIKDKDALKIVFDIIDSNKNGLYIGAMTSQILAIFYLNDMDHFIKETLKIKYYVRYQDDFLLFHPSKQYLQFCLKELKNFLAKENLVLNSKTRIYKSTDNFLFLRRNSLGRYARYRTIKRKFKSRICLYKTGKIPLNSFVSSLMCYRQLCNNPYLFKKSLTK